MYTNFKQPHTHEHWKVVDQFDSTYWSGLDVQIYANNVLIDEAIQLSYSISEQVRPYYGYASYVADRIYHGARIIQGELSLNFKRDAYLFSLINFLGKPGSRAPAADTGNGGSQSQQKFNPLSFIDSNSLPMGIGAEQLTETLASTLSSSLAASQKREIVDAYKRANIREDTVIKNTPKIKTDSGIFQVGERTGFDLSIIFGANLSSQLSLKMAGDEYEVINGQEEIVDGTVESTPGIFTSTGIRLKEVSLMGLAKTINDDGRPIIETYNFLAKDIEILTIAESSILKASATIKPPVKLIKSDSNEGIKAPAGVSRPY